MPTVNIFNPGTVGVDMKSNPLFLENKKARSAVNIAWDEGRCFTRPGFRYHSLGFSGQFQGACLFTPATGISAQQFAQPLAGLVTVVGGNVRVNDSTGGVITCNPVTVDCGDGFSHRGPVNVFGAENHLIIQNRRSNTFWWNGSGPATESPGMDDETYWVDPEVPKVTFSSEVPEADIPDCDKFPCEFDNCTLNVVEVVVTSPTAATMVIENTGTAEATITSFIATPPSGVTFNPPTLTIPAGTEREVDVVSATTNLVEAGLQIGINNSCGAMVSFVVPPEVVDPDCELTILAMSVLTQTTASIVIQNTGTDTVSGIQISPVGSIVWAFTPLAPYSLAPGAIIEVGVNSLENPLGGVPFSISTNCSGYSTGSTMPDYEPPLDCAIEVTASAGGAGEGEQSGGFSITNGGLTEIEITGMEIDGPGVEVISPSPPYSAFPFTLPPGQIAYGTFTVTGLGDGESVVGSEITAQNSCDGDSSTTIISE